MLNSCKKWWTGLKLRVAGGALLGAAVVCGSGCSTPPTKYATPDEAVAALVGALRPTLDRDKLDKILGSEGKGIAASGDDVQDRNNISEFLESYDKKHRLVANQDGDMELIVGDKDWPMPIPLVKDGNMWSFDAAAGKDELLRRRVGENELSTIQVMLAVVDAQREYTLLDPDNNGVHEYARKFLSDPGAKNGLYWKTEAGERLSPLGDLAAEAAEEGYRGSKANSAGRRPFHGYYYKMLTSQGPSATGGEQDYLMGGRLIGGFGVVAWPATYMNSGVMTFITNQDGVVYEQDLGTGTSHDAEIMTRFDPGQGWKKSDTSGK